MIISHKHKYIFIHCRKTAGSSISFMLSKSLGPWDIQLSAIAETLQAGQPIPLRTLGAGLLKSRLQLPAKPFFRRGNSHEHVASAVKQAYLKKLGHKPQHANAATIRAAFPGAWESHKKFCVVRNPYSQVVSHYNWRMRHLADPPSFLEYLRALAANDDLGGIVPVSTYNNYTQYTIDGCLAVDHVIRFEDLIHGLRQVLTPLNVPFDGILPRLKDLKNASGKARTYQDYYTQEAREIVSELHREEIEHFGYNFE